MKHSQAINRENASNHVKDYVNSKSRSIYNDRERVVCCLVTAVSFLGL